MRLRLVFMGSWRRCVSRASRTVVDDVQTEPVQDEKDLVPLDPKLLLGPGTHLIDIYPLLYPYQPAYAYPPHAAVPFLSFARDYPGLALGYRLPAFRLAVKVGA